jgi:hypothetical protein
MVRPYHSPIRSLNQAFREKPSRSGRHNEQTLALPDDTLLKAHTTIGADTLHEVAKKHCFVAW